MYEKKNQHKRIACRVPETSSDDLSSALFYLETEVFGTSYSSNILQSVNEQNLSAIYIYIYIYNNDFEVV
jgi:hypothetical protein